MAEEVQGMVFQIDVDAGQARADLRRFTKDAQQATTQADQGGKKATESFGKLERKITGVAGAQRKGAAAAGKGAAAQRGATKAATTGAAAAGKQTAAETAKAGAQTAGAAAATGETAAETANTAAKSANVKATTTASTATNVLAASVTRLTGSTIAGTAAVSGMNAALVGTGAAAGTAAVGLSSLLPFLIPIVALGVAIVVVAKAVRFLAGEMEEAISAAGSYETEVQRLSIALNNVGENTQAARRDLLDYALELQRVSVATEEQIIGALGMAISLGATTEKAKELALAATNLAAATGVDLDTAIRQLGATLGGLSGELGERIPEVKLLTEEQRRLGGAVDVVNQKFADFGLRLSTSYAGAINNVGSAFVKLRQVVGETGKDIVKIFLQEVLTPFITRTSDAAAETDTFRNAMLDVAIAVNQLILAIAIFGPALKKAIGDAIPQIGVFVTVLEKSVEALKLVGIGGEVLAKSLGEDTLSPFQLGLLKSIERLRELRETGSAAADDLGTGFDRVNDIVEPIGSGFQAILDNVAKLEDARADFDAFREALEGGAIALQGIGGDVGGAALLAQGFEKLREQGEAFVAAGIPQVFVEMALGISLAKAQVAELVGVAADLKLVDEDAANVAASIDFLNTAFEAGLVTPQAYREGMAELAEGVLALSAVGTDVFPELIEQWAWTTFVEEQLESLGAKLDFFNAQYITAGAATLGFSKKWAEGIGRTYQAVDRAANALQSALGKENKYVKGLRKIQAASMIIAGIGSIKKGAIRVAEGLPFNFLEIGAGLLMITEGIAAIAEARKLGGSGGTSASASVGAGGGGGGFAPGPPPAADGEAPGDTPPGFAQDITVFIDGTGFIQDPEEFARQIADQIAQQGARSGRTFEQ